MTDFVSSFLGALGGAALGAVLLRYLVSTLIEHRLAKALEGHKHSLELQLATLQADLARLNDVISRRNEREFAVTAEAWELINRAAGIAQTRLASGRRAPGFITLDESAALRLIDQLPFNDEQKRSLRDAPVSQRDDLYARYDRPDALRRSLEAFYEFKNHLTTRQIFFSSAIYKMLLEIRDELQGVLLDIEGYVEDEERMPRDERRKVDRFLVVELNAKLDAVAERVRKRFGFDEIE